MTNNKDLHRSPGLHNSYMRTWCSNLQHGYKLTDKVLLQIIPPLSDVVAAIQQQSHIDWAIWNNIYTALSCQDQNFALTNNFNWIRKSGHTDPCLLLLEEEVSSLFFWLVSWLQGRSRDSQCRLHMWIISSYLNTCYLLWMPQWQNCWFGWTLPKAS